MDSDTSDDMASGSKARDRGLKGDRVPQWKVSKDTFEGWWYDFDSYCATNGLSRTVIGDDRKDKMSSDEKTASKYNKKNRKLRQEGAHESPRCRVLGARTAPSTGGCQRGND